MSSFTRKPAPGRHANANVVIKYRQPCSDWCQRMDNFYFIVYVMHLLTEFLVLFFVFNYHILYAFKNVNSKTFVLSYLVCFPSVQLFTTVYPHHSHKSQHTIFLLCLNAYMQRTIWMRPARHHGIYSFSCFVCKLVQTVHVILASRVPA